MSRQKKRNAHPSPRRTARASHGGRRLVLASGRLDSEEWMPPLMITAARFALIV
jgi:hypothetical protein